MRCTARAVGAKAVTAVRTPRSARQGTGRSAAVRSPAGNRFVVVFSPAVSSRIGCPWTMLNAGTGPGGAASPAAGFAVAWPAAARVGARMLATTVTVAANLVD